MDCEKEKKKRKIKYRRCGPITGRAISIGDGFLNGAVGNRKRGKVITRELNSPVRVRRYSAVIPYTVDYTIDTIETRSSAAKL